MGVPSPLPRTQSPSSRVTKAAPRRAGRGRRGGLVTQDLGCVQKQRGRLRRALSEPSVPAARPQGVTRRPASLELAGRSAPFRPPAPRLLSPLAARPLVRALQALAGPLLSPPARGSAELVALLCPRRPPRPPATTHTHTHTHPDYSLHPRLPHSPPQSSRRAAHAGEHGRAHSAHYRNSRSAQPASPRNFQRPPRNFSQLHHGCPPPPPPL